MGEQMAQARVPLTRPRVHSPRKNGCTPEKPRVASEGLSSGMWSAGWGTDDGPATQQGSDCFSFSIFLHFVLHLVFFFIKSLFFFVDILKDIWCCSMLNLGQIGARSFPRCFYSIMKFGHCCALPRIRPSQMSITIWREEAQREGQRELLGAKCGGGWRFLFFFSFLEEVLVTGCSAFGFQGYGFGFRV